jgi:hypothetical protein
MAQPSAYSENQSVEQHSTHIEWFGESAKAKVRGLEMIGSHRKTKQWDQAVGSDGGDSTCRYKGRESDLTR